MKNLSILICSFFILSSCSSDDSVNTNTNNNTTIDCTTVTSVFSINLNPNDCNVNIQNSLGVNSIYSESTSGTTRTIQVNNVANHNVGQFPNSGNPNTITAVNETFSMTTTPSIASSTTDAQGYTTGVLFSGVVIEPYTAERFNGNQNWVYNALQSTTNLGLDCNNAHVQPNGRYHYHGTPSAFSDVQNANGTSMIKVGYAADGYPIYYKYGYDASGNNIIAYESGYQLKSGARGGDGVTAPDGCYDGTFFQDYEHVAGSDLDACNGRMGKTPESNNEYHYIITDNYPSMPLCFSGTPDSSFQH